MQVNAINLIDLWHRRLGHPSKEVLSFLPSSFGFNSSKDKHEVCEICFRAKQTHERFSVSYNKAEYISELIHCDIWGPYKEPFSSGAHYFLTIVDDASRVTWVYLMHEKNDTSQRLKSFIIMAHTQFGKRVKVVRSDNGSEFNSTPIQDFYKEQGILC